MDKHYPPKRRTVRKASPLADTLATTRANNNTRTSASYTSNSHNNTLDYDHSDEDEDDDLSNSSSSSDSEDSENLHERLKRAEGRRTIDEEKKHRSARKIRQVLGESRVDRSFAGNRRSRSSDSGNSDNKSSGSGSSCSVLYYALISLLILMAWLYWYGEGSNDVASATRRDMGTQTDDVLDEVYATLGSLRSRFKNQDKSMWSDTYAAIAGVLKDPSKPGIILLLGGKREPLDCLAALLGNVSSNAMGTERLVLRPEQMRGELGETVTMLRERIKDRKAVIFWDLLNVNVEALKAFHNLCDRHNPLIEEVIYIITIVSDDYDKQNSSVSPLEFVEAELFRKLSGKMREDAIQPLITRITDGPIFALRPEPSVLDCPLPGVSGRF